MKIQHIKEKIGYIDRPIPIIIPHHNDDICYIYGYPFQPMSYKYLKKKRIANSKIYKCQTKKQYLKDCNITNHNTKYHENN